MTMAALVCHTLVALAILAAYVALTIAGHDGTPVLGVLGGYLGGAGVTAAVTTATKGP